MANVNKKVKTKKSITRNQSPKILKRGRYILPQEAKMIKISNLSKVYKSKKRKKCYALNRINLTLPDTGLVFVLGKSGSGKSTLLNLIGGLDNITSGSIEVDGNDLSSFREGDFCNYRNSHIGFIFQDYHLIEELTVYDNIVLSLNLCHEKDKGRVKEALARVDLAGYEDRYPSELSGGEQQRVAIARAIIKNPYVILADEPTGNLDTATATSIISLLKELSHDCLILIVSHNVNDANAYADRIIELRRGEVISDKTRNPSFTEGVTYSGGRLVYPEGVPLSDGDVNLINRCNGVPLTVRRDKFLPTRPAARAKRDVKIQNKRLSRSKELRLSGAFLKNKAFSIAASAVMVSVIMVILSLAQTIINFNANRLIADEMTKYGQESLYISKTTSEDVQKLLSQNYHVEVGEGDIQAIYDAGYGGKVYPVYNVTAHIASVSNARGLVSSYFKDYIHMQESFGTMVVDEEFLERKFDGAEYLAVAKKQNPAGVIITDYVADAIILYTEWAGQDYESLLGDFVLRPNFFNPQIFINGIINTGYKERYAELFQRIYSGEYKSGTELYEDEEYLEFMREVYDCLGYNYSTNVNFAEDYRNSAYGTNYQYVHDVYINGIKCDYSDCTVLSRFDYQCNTFLSPRAWYYTETPPEIPEGAKYVRVAYGNSDLSAKYNSAVLKFSNGESATEEQLNYDYCKWLSASTGEAVLKNVEHFTTSRVSDYIEIPEGCTITEFFAFTEAVHAYCCFYDENKELISAYTPLSIVDLPKNTIYMYYKNYNEVFGTNYTENDLDTFVPHEAALSYFYGYDVEMNDPIYSNVVTIGKLTNEQNWRVSADIVEKSKSDTYVYGLYLDGMEGIGAALNATDKMNYEYQSSAIEGIRTMTKAVNVFVSIFELINIVMCVGVIMIFVSFSSKAIKDKMHDIGILKALGTKNGTIFRLFGLHVGLIALITCALSTVGYYHFIDLANTVLFESMTELVSDTHTVLNLKFFSFMPTVALMNCVLIFALALTSLIFPMIKIKQIKPVKIIKAKD